MTRMSVPPDKLGISARPKRGRWVQTERRAHEAWADLIARKPRAAQLLHQLTAKMGHQNAVVISQQTLAVLLKVHVRTVARAVSDLVDERWIQVVRIGKGKEAAYVVNDQVAWAAPRGLLRLSVFSAAVVADASEQDKRSLEPVDLRRIPTLYPGEMQLPSGPGETPGQGALTGVDPPALPNLKPVSYVDEDTGQMFDVDLETGEFQQRIPGADHDRK